MENVASRFGQRLAHTEKKYRDQALKKLSLYLTKRSEWSDLEWDKLWKALFYCMWMSDKRPIQEELSSNLAGLVHKIPRVDDALGFVHAFFRTMHREWHGIDGLRLDKFYSLIRKFVHQSLLLLQTHEWDTELVQRFVSITSSEVMSQLPNGLRLHVTDLFLTELYGAAHETLDSDTFLLLLEPFFTLLSSEYDKTVFKRVRELVFLPMLSEYVFGKPSTDKKKKKKKKTKKVDEGETDQEEEEEEEEVERFEGVELVRVQHRIFTIAAADDTAERNRSVLYELYGQFFKATKVDSLKAAVLTKESAPVKKVSAKRKQMEQEAEDKVVVDKAAEAAEDGAEKKKRKRRKKSKQTEDEDVVMEEQTPVAVEIEVATPKEEKKQKKKTNKLEETPASTPVKADKKSKKPQEAEDVVMETAETVAATDDKKKTKKTKKTKEEPVPELTPAKKEKKKEEATAITPKNEKKTKAEPVAEPTPAKKEKTAKEAVIVVRSGVKFRKCAGCGGIGKGLVPVGKETCRHCERTGALQKKALKEAKKTKRKADEMTAAASAPGSPASSKKVTFGKNRALAHELSVKRLKASAKEPATKELTEEHKGVLRVKALAASSSSSSSKASSKAKGGKRMKAADFF